MADETCRQYEVDGEPVVVRGAGRLSEQGEAALAEVVRAAREHAERTNPHGGVIQELHAAVRLAVHCIPDGTIRAGALGERDGAEVRQRLKDAAAAARAALENIEAASARDEQGRPKYARITYDGVPPPQVDPDEYCADIDDPPDLPEMCVDCRASSEDDCYCPDGYQPVRVI